ncbi:hypothetical protein [Cognaticolwellia beringensis]|uniref:hypothetical protein n=1 Tax=Cognaticolwellia beringensis TaxID=1967665 RepID=UPI0012FB322E|nr:hypothetical protein [Cognaticolwellia beringensis]
MHTKDYTRAKIRSNNKKHDPKQVIDTKENDITMSNIQKQLKTALTHHDMQGVTGSSPVASTILGFNNPLKKPESI